jgi:anti-sigma regulatory factor (Ser/Thr protein kinase)
VDISRQSLAELIGPPIEVCGDEPVLLACVRLPAQAESVGEARRVTEEVLKSSGVLTEALEDAELVVSELVTNAVVHGAKSLDQHVLLVLMQSGPTLVVKVYDVDTRIGPRKQASSDSESGRGLLIVDALADRWGATASPDGKCLWAELDVWLELPDGPEA